MTSAARPAGPRRGARDRFQYLVGALVLLAAASTVIAVVFSDNTRWLLLGVVLALWAAVVASIAMTRSRREAATAQARATDLKTVYDLELEREVSARRMHEYQVERTIREEVRAETSTDMAELRDELRALRENLAALLGGELLVERAALRAESTRLRSLSDTARLAAGGVGQIEHRRDVEDAVEEEPPHPDDVRTAGSTDATDVFPRIDDEPTDAEPLVASRDPEPVVRHDPAAEAEPPLETEPDLEAEPALVAEEPVAEPEPVAETPAPEPEPLVVETVPEPQPDVPPVAEPEPQPEPEPEPETEPEARPEPVAEAQHGGRRRRPESEDAQPQDAQPQDDRPEAADAAVEDVPPAEDEAGPGDDDEGAHSAGRSVSDLMAAYGVSTGTTPRRRRRAD